MRILGIDPGYAITGYGVIDYDNNSFKTLGYDAITTEASMKLPDRLLVLFNGIEEVIDKYKPDMMAIEELFFNTNAKTAISVSHGRGACIVAAAKAGIPIFEYTPLQIKQAVVGYGRAEKNQVQQMVKLLLHLDKVPKPDDVADGLAVAICHAHSYNPWLYR